MLINELELKGYLIQNFRDGELHDIYASPDKQESWERIPAILPAWIQLHYKYMKMGQILVQRKVYSDLDVDKIESLPTPTPLVLERYDWGDLSAGLPEKRDKLIYLFLGDGTRTPVLEDRLHKYLSKDLDGVGEKEKIFQKRRELANADIIQRALQIDEQPQALAGLRAQARDDNFTLAGTVKIFFAAFSLEMYQYINSGSLAIVDRIGEYLALEDALEFEWLKYQLPGVPSLGGFIASMFLAATQNIERREISAFWQLFRENGFVAPSEAKVAIALK